MILDEDLSDDPMSDMLLWLDEEKYKAANLDEFKKAEKAGDSGDARLRILMAAKMIQNHIKLMRATYGDVAGQIDAEEAVVEMLRKNDLALEAVSIAKEESD